MALQGYRRVEGGRAYVQESTGTRFPVRQYNKIRDAQRGATPQQSPAIKAGVSAANARAQQVISEQAAQSGTFINITEARRTARYKELTKAAKKAPKPPVVPRKPPGSGGGTGGQLQPVTRRQNRHGIDVLEVGKHFTDVQDALDYYPYRPQLPDITQMLRGIAASQTIWLVAGGVLKYKAEEIIEYVSIKTTVQGYLAAVGYVQSPEQLVDLLTGSTEAVCVTVWQNVLWSQRRLKSGRMP